MASNLFLLQNIDDRPNSWDAYLFADYLELLCLVNPDREITRADALDFIFGGRNSAEIHEESDNAMDEIGDDSIADEVESESPEPALYNDSRERMVEDWFRHLEYRAGSLTEFYPFTVSEDGRVLQRIDLITPKHRLYLFLLLSSGLKYAVTLKYQLTTTFEQLSAEVLRSCLPSTAQVHVFGTSRGSADHFRGNLLSRIRQLAEDISEKCAIDEDSSGPPSGDNGLDIVGWIPSGDDLGFKLVVFGQCACGMDWKEKQASASIGHWNSSIYFSVPPYNMVFIPFLYRKANGEWFDRRHIDQSFFIDRLRFIHFMKGKHDMLGRYEINTVIDRLLEERQPLFG